MLDGVALPNLTRDQAIERAALVTVDNYTIELDLTDGNAAPGERTFRSVTTVTFDALPGADTVIDIAADKVRSATLNGIDIDVSGYDESTGIALAGLGEHNVVVVDADCAYSHTGEGVHRFVDPVDNEVYLYSQFETADTCAALERLRDSGIVEYEQVAALKRQALEMIFEAQPPGPDCAQWIEE